MEETVRVFDVEEDFSPGAMAARTAIIRAKKHLAYARERLAPALEAHSSFYNARVAASRRLGAADRGKSAAFAEE